MPLRNAISFLKRAKLHREFTQNQRAKMLEKYNQLHRRWGFTWSARNRLGLKCGSASRGWVELCKRRTHPILAVSKHSHEFPCVPRTSCSTRYGERCRDGRFERRIHRKPRCCYVGSWWHEPSCFPIRSWCRVWDGRIAFRKCCCQHVAPSLASSWRRVSIASGGHAKVHRVPWRV